MSYHEKGPERDRVSPLGGVLSGAARLAAGTAFAAHPVQFLPYILQDIQR